jgi:hypothetical protein
LYVFPTPTSGAHTAPPELFAGAARPSRKAVIMTPREQQKQQITRVAGELSPAIKAQAQGQWSRVRTSERNQGGQHVWRFRAGPGQAERFLHIEHRAMARDNAAASLLEQLQAGRWLDRLQQGPETALLLSRDGQVTALPAR